MYISVVHNRCTTDQPMYKYYDNFQGCSLKLPLNVKKKKESRETGLNIEN